MVFEMIILTVIKQCVYVHYQHRSDHQISQHQIDQNQCVDTGIFTETHRGRSTLWMRTDDRKQFWVSKRYSAVSLAVSWFV